MNLNLVTPICKTSYGLVGSYLLKELSTTYNISLFPIGGIEAEERFHPYIKTGLENSKFFDPNAPCLRIYHQRFTQAGQRTFGMDRFIGGPRINYSFFELDRFNDYEQHMVQSCDTFIVASKWAQDIVWQYKKQEYDSDIDPLHNPDFIQKEKNKKVPVVPLGIDPTIFFPASTSSDSYKFINIGKMEKRKGHVELIEAFNLAFNEEDNVELWMSWYNNFLPESAQQDWMKLYTDSKLGSKIRFLPRVNTHSELAQYINMCDCGVFPSHAEGFNMGLLECMACGLSVITTNSSAHTEFCNNYNSILIEPIGMEEANDGFWFNGEGEWASFEIEDLVETMRTAYNNRITLNTHGIDTAKNMTWKHTANKIRNVLEM